MATTFNQQFTIKLKLDGIQKHPTPVCHNRGERGFKGNVEYSGREIVTHRKIILKFLSFFFFLPFRILKKLVNAETTRPTATDPDAASD